MASRSTVSPPKAAAPPHTATAPATLGSDGCYLALRARDARFDGQFFTGVTSTGIYCRPVCKVRTPRRENCRFFDLAAQAEAAGFRPCLRCRPEVAPTGNSAAWSLQDASSILAYQASALMDEAVTGSHEIPSMTVLASRLGVSERHLRRIFEAQWGISPLQYLQTRRLLLAKQLLTDTQLPISTVAALSGFASQRRFHAAFAERYRLQPRDIRKTATPSQAATGIRLRMAYRPPYDIDALLRFFETRAIQGVEWVDRANGSYARTLQLNHGGTPLRGWIRARFDPLECCVHLEVSELLAAALPQVQTRVRQLLDLDADPGAIAQVLQKDFPGLEGMRVPGTVDGFELAVRAVLGQQITVAAARTLAQRLTERFGAPVQTPWPALQRSFPTAQTLAQVPAEALGEVGIVRQRQKAIHALAQAMASGTLRLEPGGDIDTRMQALVALPGIGPWTASYIAMRALRWPDAFPAGDVALQNLLGVRDLPQPAQEAERASQAWRPWRSYAVVRVWHGPAPTHPTKN